MESGKKNCLKVDKQVEPKQTTSYDTVIRYRIIGKQMKLIIAAIFVQELHMQNSPPFRYVTFLSATA